MGVLYSHFMRQARRFNAGDRALRAIDRKIPVSAPRHRTTDIVFREMLEETSHIKEELQQKHQTLDTNLKKVYVTSTGDMPEIKRDLSLLPQKRGYSEEDEMGFWEPEEIPKGFVSLRHILYFLSAHQQDPQTWTVTKIAQHYSIEEQKVEQMLEFYRTFNVYMPPQRREPTGGLALLKLRDSLTQYLSQGLVMKPPIPSAKDEKTSETTKDKSSDQVKDEKG